MITAVSVKLEVDKLNNSLALYPENEDQGL